MAETDFAGFYKLTVSQRAQALKKFANLSDDELGLLQKEGGLPLETASKMIENVAGTMPLPLGFAVNFKINGITRAIPMAIEEASVVAASSNAAKLALPDGFQAHADEPIMIGQVQLVDVPDPEASAKKIIEKKSTLIKAANTPDAPLVRHGGGLKDLDAKVISTPRGKMLITYLYVDTRDAMGANAVNTFAESIAPELEEISGGKVRLRILSNLAVKRKAYARAVWSKDAIGEDTIEGILDAYEFAAADAFRAATNNKGIMNGIDALVIATGNDWRAIEAGAHAYAAITGKYLPLAKYSKDKEGSLVGEIELPMALGTVGGATKTHPIAQICLKILGVENARELAEIAACVGLAQNFAALRALATEGIQRGHMDLHSRNIAILAGAKGAQVDEIAARLVKEKKVSVQRAREFLKGM